MSTHLNRYSDGLSVSALSTALSYESLSMGEQRSLFPELGDLDVGIIASIIERAAALGFGFIDLYVDSEENLAKLLREEQNKGRIMRACDRFNVKIVRAYYNFLHARPLITGSAPSIERVWTRIGDLSRLFGIETVESISPTIPTTFASQSAGGKRRPFQSVPDSFSWTESWNSYVKGMTEYTKWAERLDLRLAVEPMSRDIVSGTDSLLRLFDSIPSDHLGAVVDIGRLHAVREIPEVSIKKLAGKIFSVHLSDNDGVTEWHWAPGQGRIDWLHVIHVLKAVGYQGTLSLDVSGIDVNNELLEAKRHIERILSMRAEGS